MTELLSVTEYAKEVGKDVGNVRKMLLSGRLEGIKIGNQWAIVKGTDYPCDERRKSGKYVNQRKINQQKAVIKSVEKMVEELVEIFGEKLDSIILYGSYARCSQTRDSDVDIAVIVKNPSKDLISKMVECVADYELQIGKVLSVIDIEENKYKTRKSFIPFYRNIENEGIVLWKAA